MCPDHSIKFLLENCPAYEVMVQRVETELDTISADSELTITRIKKMLKGIPCD